MNIITSVLAIATAMALCSCKTIVADHVPAARGTATGDIKVDALTSVSTMSTIRPGSTGSQCTPGRNSVAATNTRWATTADGITVATNRMSPVEGYHHVASGTGDLAGGVGTTLIGGAALKGKFRSQINNNNNWRNENNLRNNLRLGGCTDPNSPYIYGY